jgi:hypothetical protein
MEIQSLVQETAIIYGKYDVVHYQGILGIWRDVTIPIYFTK